ncbi:SMC-Scp complex subunit ScpB [Actinoplanes hulinensis]|uniref:SMC-Scp complex subunit ScpB n=1 Tax=Actinoplanes hulinensis TaxID=1144547 RepID=A0ABS7B5K8_9ACTN|nr:SMC-Scp complex subunit ScpB [Actinoplanes hulinensis]MBW6436286.1 SMC-Scp complex subunit ScpB [Actinoplanes hulinensis]
MSSEERPESLAAQAAAWVPPWERRREPDREYQDAAESELSEEPSPSSEPPAQAELSTQAEPEPSDEPSAEAGFELSDEPSAEAGFELSDEPEPSQAEAELPQSETELPQSETELPRPEFAAEPSWPAPEPQPEPRAAVPTQARPRREDSPAPTRTPAVVMDDAELAATLESIMLVVDEPVGELQLAQVLEQPVERIARVLEDVSARYTAAGHGIDLRRAAGGWRLYTRPEYAQYVERFVLDGQSVRLTQAALETLAVVAYKQPVTRSRISAIRGVNCDGVMRTLVTRGLIEECGTEPETGAYLYRTTSLFLEKLGLNSVDQLPPLAPFLPDDVEEVLDASG